MAQRDVGSREGRACRPPVPSQLWRAASREQAALREAALAYQQIHFADPSSSKSSQGFLWVKYFKIVLFMIYILSLTRIYKFPQGGQDKQSKR